MIGEKSGLRFYEKVIKVKADVAALLIVFSPTSTTLRPVAWRAVKGAVVGRSSRPLAALHATSKSSGGRSATQFGWASSLVEQVGFCLLSRRLPVIGSRSATSFIELTMASQPQPQSARTIFVQSARIRKAGWFRIPAKVRMASAGILGCRAASLDQDRF